MKKVNYLFFCLFLSVAILASCKSDDGGGLTPEETALAQLQGTWELENAVRDASNITAEYADMKVIIANKNLSTTGAPAGSIYPTGNFTFVGDNFNTISVDGITVTLAVNATNLVTQFSLDADGNNVSKVAVIQGDYTFSFTKAE